MVILGSLILLVGLGLLAVGIRGKLIDDHPYCRRCRFDLTGRWPEARACPECGAELRGSNVVHGRRQRRRRTTIVGSGFTTIGVLCLALIAWAAISGADLNRSKPLWLLRFEARNGGVATVAEVLSEIERRISGKSLSDTDIAALIDTGLARQADDALDWPVQWGDFIEVRRVDSNAVSDEQWRQYLREGVELSFKVRSRVRAGDKLRYSLSLPRARFGSDRRVRIVFEAIEAGDYSQPLSAINEVRADTDTANNFTSSGHLEVQLPPGEHELRVGATLQLIAGFGNAPTDQWQGQFEANLTVVEADEDTVTPVVRPSLTEALKQAIEIRSVSDTQNSDGSVRMIGSVMLDELPIDVAFDIFMVHAGSEWHAGAVMWGAGRGSLGMFAEQTFPGFDGDSIDVILRSNPQVARESLDMVEFWEGELVYENVPVERP